MITALIYFLCAVLVALIINWAISDFIPEGKAKKIVAAIFGLILLLVAFQLFKPYLPRLGVARGWQPCIALIVPR